LVAAVTSSLVTTSLATTSLVAASLAAASLAINKIIIASSLTIINQYNIAMVVTNTYLNPIKK